MLNSDRPVGFSTAHCQLALDEGADIAALEVVDDIEAVLLSLEPFLNDADRAELRDLFSGEGFPSFEDMASTVDGLLDRFNQRPLEELGGLSPDQVDSLLFQEWSDPGGPLVLVRDLPFEEVSRAPILRNARTFLDALVQEDGTKATSAGKLNRAFVRTMLREGQWPERLIRYMEKRRQVVNEGDVLPLHTLRILLDLSGLIRKRKGRFAVTRRGRDVLSEERAGELFALLFQTQFQPFQNRFFGSTANFLQGGGQLENAPSFQDFLGGVDFKDEFRRLPPGLRPGSSQAQFSPPTRFLF